jgi:hypothetical protein
MRSASSSGVDLGVHIVVDAGVSRIVCAVGFGNGVAWYRTDVRTKACVQPVSHSPSQHDQSRIHSEDDEIVANPNDVCRKGEGWRGRRMPDCRRRRPCAFRGPARRSPRPRGVLSTAVLPGTAHRCPEPSVEPDQGTEGGELRRCRQPAGAGTEARGERTRTPHSRQWARARDPPAASASGDAMREA